MARIKDSRIFSCAPNTASSAGCQRTQVRGNGLATVQQYNPASGHLWGIQTGDGFGRYIRDLSYQYDDANNLTWRADLVMDRDEAFKRLMGRMARAPDGHLLAHALSERAPGAAGE